MHLYQWFNIPKRRIPQFFNFMGSSAGNVQSVKKTPTTIFVPPSIPVTYPETQRESGYYICPFDGTKKMTANNPLVLEKQREELQKSLEQYEETLQYSGTTISPSEVARIKGEVRKEMQEQFAQARTNVLAYAKLEGNLVASKNISKSGNATADSDVIDLISQFVASL